MRLRESEELQIAQFSRVSCLRPRRDINKCGVNKKPNSVEQMSRLGCLSLGACSESGVRCVRDGIKNVINCLHDISGYLASLQPMLVPGKKIVIAICMPSHEQRIFSLDPKYLVSPVQIMHCVCSAHCSYRSIIFGRGTGDVNMLYGYGVPLRFNENSVQLRTVVSRQGKNPVCYYRRERVNGCRMPGIAQACTGMRHL